MKMKTFKIAFFSILLMLTACVPNPINKATKTSLKFAPSAKSPTATATSASPTFLNFQKVITSKCVACHNNDAIGNFSLISSETDWLRSGFITAGDYTKSSLYLSLKGANATGTMPKGLAAISTTEIQAVKDWITSTKIIKAPTISIFASSVASIKAGESVTLSWSVTDAKTLSISGIGDVTGTTSKVVTPTVSTSYTLTATSDAGTVSKVVTVNIAAGNAPVISSFSTSAASIALGGSATLSWAVTNATSISISGIGVVTGTTQVVTPKSNTTYILTATNNNGTTISSVIINIIAVPIISTFTASATSITVGDSIALSWSVMNATSITISGIGAVTGTTQVVAPIVDTTYILTAIGLGGTATNTLKILVKAATVVVTPPVVIVPTPATRFASFQNVMTSKCTACHSSDLVGNFSLLKTETDWLKSGFIVAGDIHSSSIYMALKGENATGTMPKNTTVLTAAEITAIKDWITNIQVSTNGVFTGYSVHLGNKNYVNSIFKFVFGESNKANYYEYDFTLSEQKILRNASNFQGSCDLYSMRIDTSTPQMAANPPDLRDDWCVSLTKASEQMISMIGKSNSVRHGYLTQVCEGYVNHAPSMKYAMTTHHGWVSGDLPVDDANLLIAYQNFYPEKVFPASLKTAYMNIANTTTVNSDKWKWIYLTICLSAEWQAP